MESEYILREVTPQHMLCGIGPCPGIYEIKRLTPDELRCFAGLGCPEIYEQNKDHYLIIGKVVDSKQFGLEKKVGRGEALISVPKKIIDERKG